MSRSPCQFGSSTLSCLLLLCSLMPAARAGGHFSGASASQIVVRVAPGVLPGATPDGRLTFVRTNGDAGDPAVESVLADVLGASGVCDVSPAFSAPPRNAALAEALGLTRYYFLALPVDADSARVAATLAAAPALIESAEPVHAAHLCATIPNDPQFGLQWALNNTGQVVYGHAGTPDADIDAVEAWDFETGSGFIVIAILDTGISQSHPEFQGRLIPGYNTSGGDPNATDDSLMLAHGTQCAGVAGACTNNGVGMAGVTWGAVLMPIKVIDDSGWGTDATIAQGIFAATDRGVQIISMSIGVHSAGGILQAAVSYAAASNVLLVASAGYQPEQPILLPARLPEVIAVGATDSNDVLTWFTPTGPEIDLVAPGVDILTTTDTLDQPNGYIFQTGASMSCAMTAGVAALVWSANPLLTAAEVRAILESTADDKGPPGWDPQYGWGRINAYAAVRAALAAFPCPGDLNCDGGVDFADIDPFVLSLSGEAAYVAQFPGCRWLNGDTNSDNTVDFADIDGFVGLLFTGCP